MKCLILLALVSLSGLGQVIHYDLIATKNSINLSQKKMVNFAIAINGSIPAPTLTFTEGDEAEIKVTNQVENEELSVHWHGLLLPNEMDGVPYLTTPPIRTGESHTFRFPLRQSGTYWYHSHTKLQEQKGVFGAFIILPKKPAFTYNKEAVVVLSDWTDENPDLVIQNLRKDGDYYLRKKGSIRSIIGAVRAGRLGTYFENEWTRMGGMDPSDVGYDAFLINGKKNSQLLEAKAGDKIRIRVINAAASTYFYVSLSGLPIQVISADGLDIVPVVAKEILMGMAETYDLLFTVPESRNYELKATAQDITGSTSTWIGNGVKVPAPVKPEFDLYQPMSHEGHGEHSNHSDPSHHTSHQQHHIETLTVDAIQSPKKTEYVSTEKLRELKLVLDGDMSRYIWHINGKAIHEEKNIAVKEGELLRFVFENHTMMHHPMHLHGHFFRVLNAFGSRSPLKHTVDVPPHGARTIEFYATEPGQWMLHCHNLYHMKTGMARVVNYLSYQPKPEMLHWQKHDPHNHDHLYFSGLAEIATNHVESEVKISKTWDELEGRFEARKHSDWDPEADIFIRHWFGRFFSLIGGGVLVEQDFRAVLGVSYLLPLMIPTQLLIDHRGDLRLDAKKRFQWTSVFYSEVNAIWRQHFGLDWKVSLMYSPVWALAAGVNYTGNDFGLGIQYHF